MGCYIWYSEEGHRRAAAASSGSPHRCTKCNSPPINGQCTNHRIAVFVRCSTSFTNLVARYALDLHIQSTTFLSIFICCGLGVCVPLTSASEADFVSWSNPPHVFKRLLRCFLTVGNRTFAYVPDVCKKRIGHVNGSKLHFLSTVVGFYRASAHTAH